MQGHLNEEKGSESDIPASSDVVNLIQKKVRPKIVSQGLYDAKDAAEKYDQCRVGHPEVIEQITNWYPLPQEGIIMDVGCGTANETVNLARHAEKVGNKEPLFLVELNQPMLQKAREKMQNSGFSVVCLEGKADERIPTEDESVDYVFSSFTYHHMEPPEAFFQEVHRVLKPGGRFVLLGASLEQALTRELLVFYPHLSAAESERYLSKQDLLHTFEEIGFDSVEGRELHFEDRKIDAGYVEKAEKRSLNSALRYVSDDELEEGLVRIRSAFEKHLNFRIERTAFTGVKRKKES